LNRYGQEKRMTSDVDSRDPLPAPLPPVAVAGLWHLGSVTAACMAAAGFSVTAHDEDAQTIARLREGQPPLFEPGLAELVREGIGNGRLRFTARPKDVGAAELVWITYDTPVHDDDTADVDLVVGRVSSLFPKLHRHALILISSQLPVGSTRQLEQIYQKKCPDGRATFAYSPENLRLGKAIDAFSKPQRVVVGVRSAEDRNRLAPIFGRFTDHIEWMGIESAEMTKHALNAFLATSVAFVNELAGLCERVGADAREVERGLKSEARIGPRACLRPGAAFAGGTLARDISFIEALGRRVDRPTPLFSAVRISNEAHKTWTQRRLVETLGVLEGRQIAVLGLTYKPGTDTLRRSSALELCRWLVSKRARVAAYDPMIRALPSGQDEGIELRSSVEEALRGSVAVVVATEWPEFRRIDASSTVERLAPHPTVLDPGAFLESTLGSDVRLRYITVGKPG
jgi:UDPglucose 6-dehydrogenase